MLYMTNTKRKSFIASLLILVALAVSGASLTAVRAQAAPVTCAPSVCNTQFAADEPSLREINDNKEQYNCKAAVLSKDNCGIISVLITMINVLSGLVGIVIVLVIIVGGIQYSMAEGDPGKVSAARKRIFNAVIALVLFIFSFAIIQYLVPGGLF